MEQKDQKQPFFANLAMNPNQQKSKFFSVSFLMKIPKSCAVIFACLIVTMLACNNGEELMLLSETAPLHKKNFIVNGHSTNTTPTNTTPYVSFTPAQKQMADPFIVYVKKFTYADLYNADALIAPFEIQVKNSSLSQTEKDGLLGLALAMKAMAKFIKEGGDEQIKEYLNSIGAFDTSPYPALANANCPQCPTKMPNDTGGCSVNFRNVWASAVVGFFGGGARGAIIGATAGTFTAPVVGTVTGGASGAVAGAATGFVSGAIAGVAAELILTCGR